MDIKLKSGKKVKIKDISLDERDGMLDSLEMDYTKEGESTVIKAPHSTMTKWFRLALEEGSSDEFILGLKMEEPNSAIFTHAKMEYTNQLIETLTPQFFDGIKSIYDESKIFYSSKTGTPI